MKRKRLTDDEIIGVLKDSEAGAKTDDMRLRDVFISAVFSSWRKTFGSMEASDAKLRREIEIENARPKRIVADLMLDMSAMKDLLERHWRVHGQETSRRLSDDGEKAERPAGVPDRWDFPIGAAVSAGAEG